MRFGIHFRMALLMRKQMAENGVNLDGVSFLLGNLAPDMSFSYIFRRHTRIVSLPHLNKQIKSLYKEGIDPYSLKFSWHLGVMSHYVCDFLCYPHTMAYNGNTAGHLYYEVRQSVKSSDMLPFEKPNNRGLDAIRLGIALDRFIEKRERHGLLKNGKEYNEVPAAMQIAVWASSGVFFHALLAAESGPAIPATPPLRFRAVPPGIGFGNRGGRFLSFLRPRRAGL